MFGIWTILIMATLFHSAASSPLEAVKPTPSAAAVFAELKGLVGRWEGVEPGAGTWIVDYRLIADGSALVERWSPGSKMEAMTVYTMDDDDLIATHYCPWGNQPRLRLTAPAAPQRHSFAILGGANLTAKDAHHQVGFWLRVDGPDAFTRSETYVPNGGSKPADAKPAEGVAIHYSRVASPDSTGVKR